jgi:putative acyl-CoA dehydrogenase
MNQPPPLREVDVCGLPDSEALRAFAAELAGEPRDWARVANERPPVLRGQTVEFDPAWDALLALGRRERLHQPGLHTERAAKFIALAQVEQGVGCPLSMTHAAHAVVDVPDDWLVGMSMTERQGGSDVRRNETRAQPNGDGTATLHGEKWFCSAPMSDAFLILAHAPAGLSCYLVRRGDGFVIERLKSKLGNRSNASAEIRLDGAAGTLVGDEGRGVAAIIEMVVHTRLDCVLGSAALMREAVAQALHWCHGRVAFGRLLVDQPLMQNVLADLCVEADAATASALRLARAFEDDDPVRRIATAVLKYWVCKRATAVVAEALESIGGNGFVEDASDLPRLYRESPLNAIWEGSSNVQCLDVLRTLRSDRAHGAAFIDELDPRDRPSVKRALAEADEASARRVVEAMAVALQATLLERDGDPAVAAAFRARDGRGAFGTLPRGLPLAEIVEQHVPES